MREKETSIERAVVESRSDLVDIDLEQAEVDRLEID